jgi:hypothetical protein
LPLSSLSRHRRRPESSPRCPPSAARAVARDLPPHLSPSATLDIVSSAVPTLSWSSRSPRSRPCPSPRSCSDLPRSISPCYHQPHLELLPRNLGRPDPSSSAIFGSGCWPLDLATTA